MHCGMYTKTFDHSSLGATLDAVSDHGIRSVQFNLSNAGVESMPEQIDAALIAAIRSEFESRAMAMAAVSGTFNIIHPDISRRRDGMRRLEVLAAACSGLGTGIITLSTGTCDAENMWRRHPDNDSPVAWQAMLAAMEQATSIAEQHGVTLAFEPEVSNVVDSAEKARQLLDTIGSPRLKVLIDGANLFHAGELPRMSEILKQAFALLGDDIVLAHAKDLSRDGEAGHEAAGTGLLDYGLYIKLLDEAGYTGPLILHSLSEAQIDTSVAFLREHGVD